MEIKQTVEIRHEYAIGTIERIKEGDILRKRCERTYDLEEAINIYESSFNNPESLIIMPGLIGVFRRIRIGFEHENSTGEIIENDCISEPLAEYDVHPSLVQIGYNPESFNVGLISDLIGPESKRMVIVPYRELRSKSDNLKLFSDLTSKRMANFPLVKPLTNKENVEYLTLIRELLKTDGLIKSNYDALRDSSQIIF